MEAKALGRKVHGFDADAWDRVGRDKVVIGNLAKFSQNPALSGDLVSTEDAILVEASPYDKIWGIGMGADDARDSTPQEWKGRNYLGFALMRVRSMLVDAGL